MSDRFTRSLLEAQPSSVGTRESARPIPQRVFANRKRAFQRGDLLRRPFPAWLALLLVFIIAGCQTTPTPDDQDPTAQVEVDKKSQSLFDEAVAALAAERYRDAEILLSELTARDPRLSGPWTNLGSAYLAQGKTEEAKGAFRKAIDVNPNSCAAYNELGIMARHAGDFLTAEANYLACVERVPEFREAYLNLGILYELYLGRLPEALDAYRTYQSLLESPDRRVSGWVMDLERRLVAKNDP